MRVEQTALFRMSDPETSRQAARSINTEAVESLILAVFDEYGDLTDDELADFFPDKYPPTIKTARSRLRKAGCLKDSGVRRPSNRGRAQIVWIPA